MYLNICSLSMCIIYIEIIIILSMNAPDELENKMS